eukprot:Skav204643  [mRNA]  locus=scaffold3135:1321:8457:- [translate_table: standard]
MNDTAATRVASLAQPRKIIRQGPLQLTKGHLEMGCQFDSGREAIERREAAAKETQTPSLLQSSSRAASSSLARNSKGPSVEEPQKAWAEVPQVAPAALQPELAQQWPSRNWLRRNRKMRHGRI